MLKNIYCPIAAAAKILQPKWNIEILRSICLYEVHNFNDIRRLIPNVSPTLVSNRLKFLVEYGILEKRFDDHSKSSLYVPTEAGKKLKQVLLTLGEWGREWLDQEASVHASDSGMLLWVMGHKLNTEALPTDNATLHFSLKNEESLDEKNYWFHIQDRQKPELSDRSFGCASDLIIITTRATLAACFMNYTSYQAEIACNEIILEGDEILKNTFPAWMATSEIGRNTMSKISLH